MAKMIASGRLRSPMQSVRLPSPSCSSSSFSTSGAPLDRDAYVKAHIDLVLHGLLA